MKARVTEKFTCVYIGQKLVFEKDEIAEGWPATRAIAAGKAVPYSPPVLETKVVEPEETK